MLYNSSYLTLRLYALTSSRECLGVLTEAKIQKSKIFKFEDEMKLLNNL